MKPTQVDSTMTREEILLQNPLMVAPEDVLQELTIIEVTYYGFDKTLHQGQIVVNKKIENSIEKFFALALSIQFPIEKVVPIAHQKYAWDDNLSCDDNNSSGYNFRYIGGTQRMSQHARGLAFDINPMQNPFIKYNENGEEIFRAPSSSVYEPTTPGTLSASDPLVAFLKAEGFEWGGDWTIEGGRIDYQHFEMRR